MASGEWPSSNRSSSAMTAADHAEARMPRDRVTIALECHVARLQASVATIAHHERPEYLDRLAVLRDQVFVLDHMYMSLFSTCGWILRLAVAVLLLMSIHPALALLVLFALPTVLTSTWRPGVERTAEERREAEAVNQGDVGLDRRGHDAVLETTRALDDQRKHHAVDDVGVAHLRPLSPLAGRGWRASAG